MASFNVMFCGCTVHESSNGTEVTLCDIRKDQVLALLGYEKKPEDFEEKK